MNCAVPWNVTDDVDEAELGRLMERVGRRSTAVTVATLGVPVAIGGGVYHVVGSWLFTFVAASAAYVALIARFFVIESHAEYVTDRPVDAVREEFTDERPPLLYAYWCGADEVIVHEDSVEFDHGTDDPSDNPCYRVADRSDEFVDGLTYTRDERLFSWTVRFAGDADGTRVFLTGRPSGRDSAATIASRYLAGSIEVEAMGLMGYRHVGGSTTVGLRRNRHR